MQIAAKEDRNGREGAIPDATRHRKEPGESPWYRGRKSETDCHTGWSSAAGTRLDPEPVRK